MTRMTRRRELYNKIATSKSLPPALIKHLIALTDADTRTITPNHLITDDDLTKAVDEWRIAAIALKNLQAKPNLSTPADIPIIIPPTPLAQVKDNFDIDVDGATRLSSLRSHRSAIESLIIAEAAKQKPIECPDDTTIDALAARVAALNNDVRSTQCASDERQKTHTAQMKTKDRIIEESRTEFNLLLKTLNDLNTIYDRTHRDVTEAKTKLTALRHITHQQSSQEHALRS